MLLTVLMLLLGVLTSECSPCSNTPDFLPYGGTLSEDYRMNNIPSTLGTIPRNYNAFGNSGTAFKIKYNVYLGIWSAESTSDSAHAVYVRQRALGSDDRARRGTFDWRHSNDPSDLQRVNEVLCGGSYVGVVIMTHECYTDAESPQSSFQSWLAYTDNRMVLVLLYDDPLDLNGGYISDNLVDNYPLNVPDITDDFITAIDITDAPTVSGGQSLPTLPTSSRCPPPCRGADLTGCGPITRPDPRCDPMTCAWGIVSHSYGCSDERTCDMDCYGCDDDTPKCSTIMAEMNCESEPERVSSCSKTAGVGVILFMYLCADPTEPGDQGPITCHELCCCEKNPNGGVGVTTAIHCNSPGVINKGFGDGAEQDKRAYCPGYDIPEWN